MPEYLHPGVYVEEIGLGPKPIEGVDTSTAAMVGVTLRGPVCGPPVLVTSFREFVRIFGNVLPPPAPSVSAAWADSANGGCWWSFARSVSGFFDNGGRRLYVKRIVAGAGRPTAARTAADGPAAAGVTVGALRVCAKSPGRWGNDLRVRLRATTQPIVATSDGGSSGPATVELTVQYRPGGRLEEQEVFANLPAPTGSNRDALVARVNAASNLVELLAPWTAGMPSVQSHVTHEEGDWRALEGGDDNFDRLTVDDFVGIDDASAGKTGLRALEDLADVSIVCVPGVWAPAVHQALIAQCERLKDRFAIIDPPDGLDVAAVRRVRASYDTRHAALYYPWLVVRDAASSDVTVAPSAHVAGVYARVDLARGVHKPPANEELRGVARLAVRVTDREQGVLNPEGINVLRDLPGRGLCVWGARTLTSDPLWKYVNLRRFFIYVEQSIDRGTQWVVFEPNDERLWARVERVIENFLLATWKAGALLGAKPEEAYFVQCDRRTMTQDDIDNGRLVCLVGIALIRPAEFEIFRIAHHTLERSPVSPNPPTSRSSED